MEELPDEIFSELLYRLPMKSTLRFRSVSKSWRCLIDSPYFNHRHLQQQQLNQAKHVTPRIVVLKKHELYYFDFISNKNCKSTEISNAPLSKFSKIYGIQSCNGVLCIHYSYRKIVIWNPFFKKYRELHSPTIPRHSENAFGFGYDRVSNDYKIVALQVITDHRQKHLAPTRASVYSLRLNVWKKIDGFCDRLWCPSDSFFFGNSLHWITENEGIFAFDLTTDKFHKLSLPSSCSSLPKLICSFDGCLSLTCTDFYLTRTIYVMERYADKDSWTTKLSFSKGLVEPYYWNLKLITGTQDGKVFLGEDYGNLLFYDTKNSQLINSFSDVGEAHSYFPTQGFYDGNNMNDVNEGGDKAKRSSKRIFDYWKDCYTDGYHYPTSKDELEPKVLSLLTATRQELRLFMIICSALI